MTNAENTDNACRDVNVYNAENFKKESVDMKNDNDVAVNWYYVQNSQSVDFDVAYHSVEELVSFVGLEEI